MTKPNFFNDDSPYLSHPLLTPERTAKEVSFVLSQLNLLPGARILDVGCGPGRHAIELARRGYVAVGIDPSPAMTAAAQERATAAGVSVEFRQRRGEDITDKEDFDAALCLFTTLGQISERGENTRLIQRAYDALRPHGYFVVETPQRSWVAEHLKATDRFGEGEHYTDVRRQYDPEERTVTELFQVVSPASTRDYLLCYRLYSQDELSDLLRRAGFAIVASFGDYRGSPLGPGSQIMLLIGQK